MMMTSMSASRLLRRRRPPAIAGSSSTTSTTGFMAPPARLASRRLHRQQHPHLRAPPELAPDVHAPPVLFHDGARDGHAEACAAVLGGEEKLEGARPRLLRHAAARALH